MHASRSRALLVVALALTVMSVGASCSKQAAAPAEEGVATLSTDPPSAGTTAKPGGITQSDEPKLRDFSKCARENGMPNFPDPKFTAAGKLDLADLMSGKIDISSPDFQNVLQACQKKLEGVNIGSNFDRSKILDAVLTFTKCLRANGLPDVKDPTPEQVNGGGDGGGPPSIPPTQPGETGGLLGKDRLARQFGLDPKDPKVMAAMDVCQPEFAKAIGTAITGSIAG